MKAIILTGLMTLSVSTFAKKEIECRKVVIEAYSLYGTDMNDDDFSSMQFSDLNLSIEEFNDLSNDEQLEYHLKLTPLSQVIDKLRGRLGRTIGNISFFNPSFFMVKDVLTKVIDCANNVES